MLSRVTIALVLCKDIQEGSRSQVFLDVFIEVFDSAEKSVISSFYHKPEAVEEEI
jgi:hypothetical protein